MKKNTFCLGLLVVFTLAFIFTACGGGNSPTPPPGGDPALTGTVIIQLEGTQGSTFFRVGDKVEAVADTNVTLPDYQWQKSPSADGPFTNIEGADEETYEIDVDEGTYIRVLVSAVGYTGTLPSDAVLVRAEDAEPEAKTIIVTGLSEYRAVEYLSLSVIDDFPITDNTVAMGSGSVNTDGEATFELNLPSFSFPPEPWTGDGQYWIVLQIGDSQYLYTNEQDYNPTLTSNPKYHISTEAESTIAFDKFALIVTGAGGHQLTISDIDSAFNGGTATVRIGTIDEEDGVYVDAYSTGTITGGSVTLNLIDAENDISGWTGSGSYHVALELSSSNYSLYDVYLFTDGKTLEEAGINYSDETYKADKFTFSGNSSEIAFNKFVSIGDLGNPGTSIIITGVSSDAEWPSITLYKDGTYAYYGGGNIDDGTATFNIDYWDGTGSYQIQLSLGYEATYLYTGGEELGELEIFDIFDVSQHAPEYDFDSEGTTLAFSDFRLLDFSSEGQTITITGMDSFDDEPFRVMISTFDFYDTTYDGEGYVTDGTLTVELSAYGGIGWDGYGSYKITLTRLVYVESEWGDYYEEQEEYVYTGGEELEDLDISIMGDLYEEGKLPLYDFDADGSEIDFDQFRDTSDLSWF